MAKPSTVSASSILVLVGDGASPETFAQPCGFTSRGFNRTTDVSEVDVPDCDDPDAPGWTEREVRSLSAAVSGEGVIAKESLDVWDEWYESGAARNCKVRFNNYGGTGVHRDYEGEFILTRFELGGENKTRANVTVELQSNGPVPLAA